MLPSNLFTLQSAIGFTLVASTSIAVLAIPFFKRLGKARLFAVASGLLAFQVFHFAEHLIQLGYWVLHPGAAPYMTPWAMEGVDGLALWAAELPGSGATVARGMELLHLAGNSLFLVGIIALQRFSTKQLPGLRSAKVIQSVHVAEHVLLTVTLFGLGRPLGLSTLFGLSAGMPWAGSVRIWFHFLINLAATIPAVIALRSLEPQGTVSTPKKAMAEVS